MKSRSQRLPTSVDPHDDWVEESWTVDCVCGVNFDDGEEMVNCDECGVWVHTRCSRYVKSEKSFACHKCKNKNIVRNDSEETEVAQLLVELPTKTLRLDNPPPPPLPPPSSYKASPFPPPARKAFRLWTDIPIEDRVHVQGVPGGDPSLFSGFSSIFGPQLWKCSGYVPKKFNFRYSEFPCWDKEEVLEKDLEKNSGGESEINADNGGAGALFYLSNENSLPAPAVDSVSVESQAVDCNSERVVSQKETNKSEVENSDVPRPKNEVKKDKSLLQPSVIHFAKHKEDMGMSNDKSAKKKARIIEKEGDFKKKCLYTSGTASTKSSDVKQIQFSEDRGLKVVQVNSQNSKNGNSSHCLTLGQLPCDPGMVDYVIDAQKNNLASGENDSENSSFDASGHNTLSSATPKEENGGHRVPVKLEDSSKTVDGAVPLLGQNDSWGVPIKEEVHIGTDVSPNEFGGELTTRLEMDVLKSEPVPEDVGTAEPETEDNENAPDSSIDMVASCSDLHAQAKMELADNHSNHVQPPLLHDAKLGVLGTSVQSQEKSAHSLSENVKDCETTVNVLETNNSKVEDAVRRLEVFDIQKDGVDGESPLDQSQPNHACAGLDGSLEAKKVSAGSGSNSFVESSKSSVAVLNPPVDSDEGKVLACLVSSSLTSSALVMCKPSASEYHINASSQGHNMDSKQKGMPESSLAGNQDNAGASNEAVKDDRRHEQAKKLVKEIPKSSLSSVAKSTQLKKYSHAIVSKRTSPDSKETVLHSSSLSPVPHIGSSPGSEQANVQQTESVPNIQKKASALQTETASSFQKKVTGSVLSQKGEKTNQSVGQSSSKVNTTVTHAATSSNSPATLSDEELALLLHQELNSSPRVPRVPRMRHAGSLPQLTSPTATSMLMKRTFSTGGKDHGLTSRRKDKDSVKDGSHGSREMDNKAKKVETVPASCDLGRQDSAFASNSVSKREADSGSANGVYSRKKSNGPVGATSSGGLSSPADGNENSFSSTRHSSRIPSDDEKRVVGRLTHRTLPGLIAEIMSKGKRMTYEELCNAVLLHWPNLRKHNGERYAYTSHSQAVLDCLRNRNEWARLVDRGPKTSGGRKRRKLESDPAGVDSEDNDDSRDQTATDMRSKTVESQHEEFPKGKRNARKRRRLALQGRGIKDVRRRRRTDELGDDEVGSFSDSSEETMFSEDEIQGCGNSAARNEVSLSSDGTSNI